MNKDQFWNVMSMAFYVCVLLVLGSMTAGIVVKVFTNIVNYPCN